MKITLITVCLNSDKTIKETLKSVANQTYKNFEHIIVDGKSSDQTLPIINNYPHVSKVLSERDDGVYHAMNKGINLASGDVVGFLNSDDIYASNDILKNVAYLFENNSSLDACYADLVYFNKIDTSKLVRYWKSNKFVKGSFSKGWSPPHPTFFVRRQVYERFGNFNLNYSISSDIELMMRLLEIHKINTMYIPQTWIKMRMGGLSNKNFKSILKLNKEIIYALKKHKLFKNYISYFAYKFLSRFKQFFIYNKINFV